MVHVHTDLPRHAGERAAAQRLIAIADDKTHLWFSVNYLPGVSDLDALILQEEIGVFAVEIKAVSQEMIVDYGPDRCVIKDRHGSRTPLQQARTSQLGLIDYLRDVQGMERPPFIHLTALWPKIDRHGFTTQWAHPTVEAQSASMLFAEDLADQTALLERLQHIVKHPAYGKAVARPRPPTPQQVERVTYALATRITTRRPADDKLLRALEHSFTSQAKQDTTKSAPSKPSIWAPGQPQKVIVRGHVGTGKTYRLLSVGLDHARQGRRVLFTCYNKVLGAELRRLLHSDPAYSDLTGQVDVVDIEQLLARQGPVTPAMGDYNAQRAEDVRALMGTDPLDSYDTMLVDEAQDMQPWAFDLLEWVAAPNADWYIAVGAGQELYRTEPAPWLTRAITSGTAYTTRRAFRTAGPSFLVPQCFMEATPDTSQIERWFARYDRRPEAELALFDRADPAPALISLAEVPLKGWRDARIADYARVIERELNAVKSLGTAEDLLIMVPKTHTKGSEGKWVLDALKKLNVDALDQVGSPNRRQMLEPGQVRVVTYHSARGLEAARALVFGFHRLEALGTPAQQRALGYIALSRGRQGTTVAVEPGARSEHLDFLTSACRVAQGT